MRIVVVSPHRDDAAFSLGLAIGAWLAAGHKVNVVNCFTRSAYAPFSDADSVHANDRMSFVTAVRLREDEAWRKQYGPGLSLTDLNLKDAPIRLRCSLEELGSVEVNPADKAIAKIGRALEMARGDALVLPLALGGHVDHRTARLAGIPGPEKAPVLAFYEDLPYAGRPDVVEGIDGSAAKVAEALGQELQPAFAAAPAEDVEAAVKRRRRLALCYDSQIDDAEVGAIAGFCRRYEGRERLWANAAWKRAGL